MNPRVLFALLAVSAGSAVVINSLFILIVLRYSSSSIGIYRWFLVAFSLFEALYATVVFLGLPVHLIADNSWIVFSHGSLLENTSLSFWGPGLYCAFYELWIGFVVTLFVYRYVVVCLSDLKQQIIHSNGLKIFIFLLYLTHFVYSVICGMYWCTRNTPSLVMQNAVREQFDIEDFEKLGYMLMGFKNADGSFSPSGSISVINHYILVVFSATIICFCCVSIWRNLQQHSKQLSQLREIHLHKQIFFTLVLQTIIPLLACHIPTLIFLTYPLWPAESKFGSATSILSVLTTLPKVLDPIVSVICIHDYRRAVLNMLRAKACASGNMLVSVNLRVIQQIPRALGILSILLNIFVFVFIISTSSAQMDTYKYVLTMLMLSAFIFDFVLSTAISPLPIPGAQGAQMVRFLAKTFQSGGNNFALLSLYLFLIQILSVLFGFAFREFQLCVKRAVFFVVYSASSLLLLLGLLVFPFVFYPITVPDTMARSFLNQYNIEVAEECAVFLIYFYDDQVDFMPVVIFFTIFIIFCMSLISLSIYKIKSALDGYFWLSESSLRTQKMFLTALIWQSSIPFLLLVCPCLLVLLAMYVVPYVSLFQEIDLPTHLITLALLMPCVFSAAQIICMVYYTTPYRKTAKFYIFKLTCQKIEDSATSSRLFSVSSRAKISPAAE